MESKNISNIREDISKLLENHSRLSPKEKNALEEEIYILFKKALKSMEEERKQRVIQAQKQGQQKAKEKGVHIGRKKAYNENDYIEMFKAIENKELTNDQAMERYSLSRSTFFRLKRKLKTGATPTGST
ncbi:MAG: helix-turn-helix domain-containing protein [Firmicutes bacterium]|nr:helix-turn-helix domain-containing protein [Bacillota bacterium]